MFDGGSWEVIPVVPIAPDFSKRPWDQRSLKSAASWSDSWHRQGLEGGESDCIVASPSRGPSGEVTVVDALRLSDAEWYACVSEMDRKSSQSKVEKERRRDERLPYRNSTYVIIVLHNFDGRQQHFRVRTYDLSKTGVSFLHGAYIYEQTHVELWMQHRVTGTTRIHATIRSCVHVKRMIHRVSAEFDEPIDLDDYLLAEAG